MPSFDPQGERAPERCDLAIVGAGILGLAVARELIKTGYTARRIVPDWTPETFARQQLFGCTCGPGTTLLCRRDVFADVGPFDEKLRRLFGRSLKLRQVSAGGCNACSALLSRLAA